MIPPRKEHELEEFDSQPGDPVFSEVGTFDSDDTEDTDEDDAEDNDDDGSNISGGNVKMGGSQASLPRTSVESDELASETIRKHKALCHEDIVLWII